MLRFTAQMRPTVTPTRMAMIMEMRISSSVTGKRSARRSLTSWPLKCDTPMSPRTKLVSQVQYWT